MTARYDWVLVYRSRCPPKACGWRGLDDQVLPFAVKSL